MVWSRRQDVRWHHSPTMTPPCRPQRNRGCGSKRPGPGAASSTAAGGPGRPIRSLEFPAWSAHSTPGESPAVRLLLSAAGWSRRPHHIEVNGRTVTLGYFSDQPASILTASQSDGGSRDLLVIWTEPDADTLIMTRAVRLLPCRAPVVRSVARVLQGGDQREGGLGALVEVGAVPGQPVVAAAGVRVPHRGRRRRWRRGTSRRTAAPRRTRPASPVPAAAVAQASASAATSIGCWSYRSRAAAPPPAGRRARPTAARRRAGCRAARSASAARRPAAAASPQEVPGGDDDLGERGVGVGQPLLRPRPPRVRSRAARPRAAASASSAARRRRCPGRRAAPRRRRARRRPWRAGPASGGRRPG